MVSIDEEEEPESTESGFSEKSKEYIDKKRIETEPEPEFEIIPNSEQTLELLVHVQTAYCTFSLDTKTLQFENTYVFDTRTLDVCMENTGTILLEGKWHVKVRIDQKSALEISSQNAYSHEYLCYNEVPISINPEEILIKAGSQQIFQVKFSPVVVETFEGSILAAISNLLPNSKETQLKVVARSLLPFCHFKLEYSDYLTGNRRDKHLRIPPGVVLDDSIKVIEINVSGIGNEITKSLTVVNPTNVDNFYQWHKMESQTDDFTCLSPTGNLHAGVSTQISFKFRSRTIGITESFWKFILPNVNFVVPFLIAGIVREPEVFASCSAITIGPLLKGQSNERNFDLINHDDCRMDFSFVPESCYTSGRQMHLQINPMTGVIPPNSRNHVRVNFKAIAAGHFNFTLFCNLPKRSTPIKINVKVMVYEMKLLVYSTSGSDRVEIQPNKACKMDLGKVNIGEVLSSTIVIVNSGDIGFEYKWSIQLKHNRSSDLTTSISPDVGYVKRNESETCVAYIKPNIECKVEQVDFKLKVLGGPSYTLSISGEGELPGVTFNNSLVDFGFCFSNFSSKEKVISVTNTHRKSLSIQCLYVSTNTLSVRFETCVIAPQESRNIVFVFTPKMVKLYEEKISFLINSHITKTVTVVGEGIEMKVAVANFHDKVIKFGALRIGNMKRKSIMVVNSSKALINRASFQLSLDSTNAQLSDSLTVSGKCAIVLEAMRGQCSVDLIFAPKRRVPNFKVELMFVAENTRLPISVITGSCKALEVSLVDSVIKFGPVVENTTFHWEEFKFFPDFSVSPNSGYIAPDSQVSFTMSFHPTKMSQEIKRDVRALKVKCYLEQGQTLLVSLLGSCIEIPANAKMLTFSTPVRKIDRQEIIIKNDSSEVWKVHPKVNGEFWHLPPVLIIGANENKLFDIVYSPLTMTREHTHQGGVFILLPNGSHLAFNLVGHSLPPTVVAVINRNIQCRVEYVESLTLDNWFPSAHRLLINNFVNHYCESAYYCCSSRFKVKIETEEKLDPSTFVNGTRFIDILGKQKKDYKLRFLAYKEITATIKVTFRSEETGEYEFYDLVYKSYKAGPEETLQLTTTLRSTFQRKIVIKNPLTVSVTFSVMCDHHEIKVPSWFTIAAGSEVGKQSGFMTLEFTPLHLGEEFGWIELNSPDLGSFEYEIVTKCTHVAPEKTVVISTYIGMSCITTVRVPNPFPNQKFELTIKVIDDSDFQVDKPSLMISQGAAEIIFDLSFDPSSIGEIRANVTLTSPTTGDFLIPLLGTGLPPKAQGPIPLKAGFPTYITIRNPFTFNIILENSVDNSQFTIAPYPEELKVMILFDPSTNTVAETMTGKVLFNAIREDTSVNILL
uniref:HYDIN/VesB/CFA65-like Ig-like domain-containing protein n=1 Tax=Strigamia maritima TaxID=126957 RepID=T1J489_STRMM